MPSDKMFACVTYNSSIPKRKEDAANWHGNNITRRQGFVNRKIDIFSDFVMIEQKTEKKVIHLDSNMTVLLVEDDEILAGEIRQFLEKWGYRAVLASRFDDIAAEFRACLPHLVLMDINLPFYDGFYWCGKIRAVSDIPILFISSKNDDRDKIMAIAQGGDDYVEKPFRLELLKAKMEAVLRRTYQYQVRGRQYFGEDFYLEEDTALLVCRGRKFDLTKSEYKIISRLLEQKPEGVTREELMMELWSTDEFVSDGTLTTLISRLRSKLKAAGGDEVIRTKKGLGYYIV